MNWEVSQVKRITTKDNGRTSQYGFQFKGIQPCELSLDHKPGFQWNQKARAADLLPDGALSILHRLDDLVNALISSIAQDEPREPIRQIPDPAAARRKMDPRRRQVTSSSGRIPHSVGIVGSHTLEIPERTSPRRAGIRVARGPQMGIKQIESKSRAKGVEDRVAAQEIEMETGGNERGERDRRPRLALLLSCEWCERARKKGGKIRRTCYYIIFFISGGLIKEI